MENKSETYKKVKELGDGAFGKAYLVKCQVEKCFAVIKQIDMSTMTETEKYQVMTEAKALELMQHPNIIGFKDFYKTKNLKFHIVMEFAENGDIEKLIKQKWKNAQETKQVEYFSEYQILNWFTQICLAVKHVHDRLIMHRDLKTQNIFLNKKFMVKLGDFGTARILSNDESFAMSVVGTPYYISPEIIKNQPYSFYSDIWSLGVLLHEMCSLKPPFNGRNIIELGQQIVKGKLTKIPSHYSKQLQNLIKAMLNLDAKKRPTITQILKYGPISEMAKQILTSKDFQNEYQDTMVRRGKNEEKAVEFQEIIKLPKYIEDENIYLAYQEYAQNLLSQIGSNSKIEQNEDKKQNFVSKVENDELHENFTLDKNSAADSDSFRKYMIDKFGQEQFEKGYEIIKENYKILYEDQGKVEELVKEQGISESKNFMELCTQHLLVYQAIQQSKKE